LAHNLALGGVSLTVTPVAGFMIEAVLAFFLVTVVLSTAVAGRAGSLAPLAIGMTLTFNILTELSPVLLLTPRGHSARWSRPADLLTPGCTLLPPLSGRLSPPPCTRVSSSSLAREEGQTRLPQHLPNEGRLDAYSVAEPIRAARARTRRSEGRWSAFRSGGGWMSHQRW